jgi:hypothetical protein
VNVASSPVDRALAELTASVEEVERTVRRLAEASDGRAAISEDRAIRLAHSPLARYESVRLRSRYLALREQVESLREAVDALLAERSATIRQPTSGGPSTGRNGAAAGRRGSGTDLDPGDLVGLAGAKTLGVAMGDVVHTTLVLIPAAEQAAVSVCHGDGSLCPLAGTASLGPLVELENELGEGPDLDAVGSGEVVLVSDAASAQRWPALAGRVAPRRLWPLAAFPIGPGVGHDGGALTVLGGAPTEFSAADRRTGELLAAQALAMLDAAAAVINLNRALHSRDVIGQAKGVLMSKYGLTEERAFAALVRRSQSSNIRVVELAQRVVREMSLDGQEM